MAADRPHTSNHSSLSISISDSSDADEPPISNRHETSFSTRSTLKQSLFSWVLRSPKVSYENLSHNSSGTSMPRQSTDSESSDVSTTSATELALTKTTKPSTFASSLKELLFASSWLNSLIVFVPLGAAAYMTDTYPAVVFISNAIAIVPLSALLTDATERIAKDAGDTVGALLNISLGNLVELIIFVALKNGHIRIVCASILGSVLVNLLLILGTALLAVSMGSQENAYSPAATPLLGSLLFVSVLAFLMPTAFDYTFQEKSSKDANLNMSRVSSLIVLGIYVIYIMYELRSRRPNISHHAADMESQPPSRMPSHSRSRSMDRPEPLTEMRGQQQPQAAVLGPRTIRFADDSESEVSAITSFKVLPSGEPDLGTIPSPYGDDPSEDHRRRPRTRSRSGGSVYQQAFSGGSTGRSRSGSYTSGRSRDPSLGPDGRRALVRSGLPTMRSIRTSFDEVSFNLDELEPEEPSSLTRSNKAVGMAVAIVVLVVSSILMSMNAEFLVSTIDEMTHEGGLLSEAIIGLIILPIVGNMAEYITVVTVAVRRNLDLAVAVSVGSSIQIALCVTPLTVLASWILDREMILTFNYFEMSTLVGAVLLVNLIILGEGNAAADSTANALKGGLMCGCYAMISIGAYLSP